jgi:calcium-dependent protein kinase
MPSNLYACLFIDHSYGFKITGFQGEQEFFLESAEEQETWLKCMKQVCVCSSISVDYLFGKLVGKGNFAKVHVGKAKRNEKCYAIKSIDKVKLKENPKNLICLNKEIQILRRIDHPNVIKLYEVYENDVYVHLVLEYLKGGELLLQIQKKGAYSEKDAAIAIKCVLSALDYCHKRNIVHRDLKPENLILVYSHSLFY